MLSKLFILTLLTNISIDAFAHEEHHNINSPVIVLDSVEPITPIPHPSIENHKKIQLGKKLFEEKRLSHDDTTACQSCHFLNKGGADGKKLSPSIDGGYRSRNTSSIFNVGLYSLIGWDGLPKSLEQVVDAILKSKKGLNSNWSAVIQKLSPDEQYQVAFSQVYNDGINDDNIKNAIVAYMRSLNTPDSRFDKYLTGNTSAITDAEKKGYLLFKSYGCSSCHQGVAIGGNMVSPYSLFRNNLLPNSNISKLELGRFKKTNDEADKYVFRVPSLRNVALTAPYFHDGSVKTLEEAIDIMGRNMLGRAIDNQDRKLIVAFLKTLTGELQGKPL